MPDVLDILIVGGGPSGATAGLVAARAGARVSIIDRDTFPRDKLCGDTVNPGTLAILRRLGVSADVEARGLPVCGMVVTGEGGARVAGRYPPHLQGRAILRRDLDWILLREALAAGCTFEPGLVARRAILRAASNGSTVAGVAAVAHSDRAERLLHARVVIAADGGRSTLAFGLGLARHPAHPRRWAIGGYWSGVAGPQTTAPRDHADSDPQQFGEMHVRRHGYIGVAPVPGGLTNVCLVRPSRPGDAQFRDPTAALRRAVATDPMLRERFAGATLVARPGVLGPLASDVAPGSFDGLLLAGDAAGFIDPMTGDGLRFAIRGGELAGQAALRALDRGWTDVHRSLAAARADAFASKWRFNRALRAIVASPTSVAAGAIGARLVPAAFRAIIARAGDCDTAPAG